jgi:FKBP-type peptidyl-prolyl cis-trans isomerase
MKNSLILLAVFIAAISLSSCDSGNNGDVKGFKKNKEGINYKFYVQNDTGAMPKEGDYITLNMVNRTDDTVFFDSKTNPGAMTIPMVKPQSGDIYAAFGMMHVGDSATFAIRTDSLFKENKQIMPPWLKDAEFVYFDVRLVDVQTQEQYIAAKQAEAKEKQVKESALIEKYIEDNDITAPPTESGLYVVVEEKGNGPKPKKGDKVTVHYTGYLLDGTKFDSSVDRGKPFNFTLGANQVIKGWDEGIAMLNIGSKAKLIIPSNLGYGERGAGPIPPFSPLVFEVELIDAEPATPSK